MSQPVSGSEGSGRAEPELVRRLGLFDSTMMLVGIVIGSGIFLTTGIMAASIPSAGLILLAWLVGGLLTLAGAITFAELGVSMPEAGGQYVYLREAYGHLAGFLFGWVLFCVAMTGSIAALGMAFAEYFGYFFPALSTDEVIFSAVGSILGRGFHYSLSMGQIVAVVLILLLSGFNYIGVGPGKTIQNVITVVKIGTILVLIAVGLTMGKGTPVDFSLSPIHMSFGRMLAGFGVALIAVSWAFDGWHNLNYVAGEIRKPEKNLPFALVIGTLVITVLYLLVNCVYLRALPVEGMSGVVRIAEKSISALFGTASAGLISAVVLVSVFGALNGSIFVGPRVYYAMARDGLFFQRVAEVHPRFRTPAVAIVFQAIWAILLTLTGTFEQLFTFVMFITILFWISAVASVFTLRRKYPDLPRPYKTWGYPVVPAVFIVASSALLLNTLVERPVESLAGVGLAVIGLPVYYFWRRGTSRPAAGGKGKYQGKIEGEVNAEKQWR